MARVHTLYADVRGNTMDEPALAAVGVSWNEARVLAQDEFIPLPEGATLVQLPDREPLGFDRLTEEYLTIGSDDPEAPMTAVAALLPQGYTRTYLPAFDTREGEEPRTLPLFGYAAVGWRGGFVCAALRTDEPEKWNPVNYNTPSLKKKLDALAAEFPGNRLVEHLANCATVYGCFTAQNLFYRRWEAGIPVSPVCNADCVGCISLQASECCPSPQNRITFSPSVDEVTELAVAHLTHANEAIISFGQGCEGEPSLATDLLVEAIGRIREKTRRGTININSNAGNTAAIGRIAAAGLDSIRVSMISATPEFYAAYHRPRGYGLEDVAASIRRAKSEGVFVSLNLLTFPGLSDRPEEIERLTAFTRDNGVDMIQLRNLNLDPGALTSLLPDPETEPVGIRTMIATLRDRVPGLAIGNYSRAIGARPPRR